MQNLLLTIGLLNYVFLTTHLNKIQLKSKVIAIDTTKNIYPVSWKKSLN